jgi:hypothetical protein
VEKLRVKHSVLIVMGDHSGLRKLIRICYGSPRDELLEGPSRIDRAVIGLARRSVTRAN